MSQPESLDLTLGMPPAPKTPNQLAKDAAMLAFTAGPATAVQKSAKRRSGASRVAAAAPNDAQALSEFLTRYRTQVTIESSGIKVTMRGFVHIDTSGPLHAMSVLTWGDDATSLSLPADPDRLLIIRLEDQRVFNALFVGSSVRLGLRGCLIGFTLIPDDHQESHTADT